MNPRAYTWTGSSFEPLRRFQKDCDADFVIGERYVLEVVEERSSASHRHFFAQVADVWANLPEQYDGRFPTAEHLRAHLLIKAGYCNHAQHPCQSRAEAVRTRAIISSLNEYAIVIVEGNVVNVFTAQSMSYRSMPKQTFQEAKDKILALMDDMLGVDRGVTEQHSARAA